MGSRANSKNIASIPSKDKTNINYYQKKDENKIDATIDLSDLSLSTEQCPLTINKIKNLKEEDKAIDNEYEEDKNLNINNEYFENENKNIINQPGIKLLHKNKNLNNLYHEKNIKSFSNPYSKILSHMSSNQTKENSILDKNIENDINYGQDKNSESPIKQKKEVNLANKISYKNFKSKKENKQKTKDIEKDIKQKEINKDQTKFKNNNKTNNIIKKANVNPFNHINFNQIYFVKNNDNNSNKKNLLKNININEINNDKKSIINESIKEEKQKETDINDIKSSFYDHEDFAIISYDYSLNDTKKNLAINNVSNLILKGGISKIKFITILESVIRKNIYHYIFNYFKKIYTKDGEEEKKVDDSSLTINDSCSYVPSKRIEKKNIIFEYAKTDISKKNKTSSNNKSKINIKKNNQNVK